MIHFIQKKTKIFEKKGFKKFQQNWLLIYNNWAGLSCFDIEDAAFRLKTWLSKNEENIPFCRIFILSGSGQSTLEFNSELPNFKLYESNGNGPKI